MVFKAKFRLAFHQIPSAAKIDKSSHFDLFIGGLPKKIWPFLGLSASHPLLQIEIHPQKSDSVVYANWYPVFQNTKCPTGHFGYPHRSIYQTYSGPISRQRGQLHSIIPWQTGFINLLDGECYTKYNLALARRCIHPRSIKKLTANPKLKLRYFPGQKLWMISSHKINE